MNRFIRLLQTYLVFGSPFVLGCMLWEAADPAVSDMAGLSHWLWEALSWNLMLWFVCLPLFLILLVLVPAAREKTLKRLANLHERDEREEFITGRAARNAYISSLSVLILLLFVSIFTLQVERHPLDGKGHSGSVSIGLQFSLLDKRAESPNGTVVQTDGIPLSKPALILALIVWQLASFSLSARREAGR